MAGYYKLNLYAKRIQIAGSADVNQNLPYSHQLIKELVIDFLGKNAGFVVNIGREPIMNGYPTIFDWTILETVSQYYKTHHNKPVSTLGSCILAFGLTNWKRNIPQDRQLLWTYLVENNLVEVIQLKENHSFGGKLRDTQSSMADLLITLGGNRGVHHLIDLFLQQKKPVICLNISLGIEETASEIHYKRLCENPESYLETDENYNIGARLSLLNLENPQDTGKVIGLLNDIISHILPPKAFFIRLMDSEHQDFSEVENYFRMIVDPVLEKIEYRRFECGFDPSSEPFMNLEIFDNLHYSSLAFADLTGLRSNCLLELGYSLGQQKKYIISAKKDTKLPFDTKMIYCHFWNLDNGIEVEKKRLEKFIQQHINKKPLISK